MFFKKPEFADEFTHTESTGPDVRNINQYSAEDLARKMCWQISSPLLVLVLVLAAHQCSASCFGKDAHFKATDVSLSVNLSLDFCFSAATRGEPGVPD